MDVMLKNGKIANKRARCRSAEDARVAMEIRGITTDAYWMRARCRSAEDARVAMEIRGITTDAYWIAVIGHAVFVYWFQER